MSTYVAIVYSKYIHTFNFLYIIYIHIVLCVATLSLHDYIEVILDEQKYEAIQYTYLSVLFCLHCVFLATCVTLVFLMFSTSLNRKLLYVPCMNEIKSSAAKKTSPSNTLTISDVRSVSAVRLVPICHCKAGRCMSLRKAFHLVTRPLLFFILSLSCHSSWCLL